MSIKDNELLAIDLLKKVARHWPDTISLFSLSGTLFVVRNNGEILTNIGIPNDGGDPYIEKRNGKEYIL